jgi:squalene-hopene/tetraprenyl-beta-curcumene cyclase
MSPQGQVWRSLLLRFGRLLNLREKHGSEPRRGVDYLIRNQDQDGSWHGHRGANYIYETFLALRGLRAAGEDEREAHMLRAGEWLRSVQNADGGWGESCSSDDNDTFVPAESTASQTAWAVLGLLASGDSRSLSVVQGVEYLRKARRDDGSWDEEPATETGFPVLALSEFLKTRGTDIGEGA